MIEPIFWPLLPVAVAIAFLYGPRLARRLPSPSMRRYAAALLLVVGLLLLLRAAGGA